jgi:hypothetical protein
METDVTVNDAATPDNGLLVRLRNNPVIPDFDFTPRSAAEVCAHIAAAIDAARVPWERGNAHRIDVACDDDEELVAPVPAPRRQRKRSLAKVCEAARKAGADRVIVDGAVIVLSPAAAVPETDANEWDVVLPGGDHGPH